MTKFTPVQVHTCKLVVFSCSASGRVAGTKLSLYYSGTVKRNFDRNRFFVYFVLSFFSFRYDSFFEIYLFYSRLSSPSSCCSSSPIGFFYLLAFSVCYLWGHHVFKMLINDFFTRRRRRKKPESTAVCHWNLSVRTGSSHHWGIPIEL